MPAIESVTTPAVPNDISGVPLALNWARAIDMGLDAICTFPDTTILPSPSTAMSEPTAPEPFAKLVVTTPPEPNVLSSISPSACSGQHRTDCSRRCFGRS